MRLPSSVAQHRLKSWGDLWSSSPPSPISESSGRDRDSLGARRSLRLFMKCSSPNGSEQRAYLVHVVARLVIRGSVLAASSRWVSTRGTTSTGEQEKGPHRGLNV
mmetsp:Transcript_26115/g.68696  ORF Transcript_26115/g.68696 Transcript_26115/m.68696 type:complete len:105 (+) Transcript_26115:652-966(+)